LAGKNVSEMTYFVSGGSYNLNSLNQSMGSSVMIESHIVSGSLLVKALTKLLYVAACRPAMECYRSRQTTTTDASEQNNTAPLGRPVILLALTNTHISSSNYRQFVSHSCTEPGEA